MLNLRKRAIWVCVAVALIGVGGGWLYHEAKIDKCLDGGGSWDYQAGACKTAENK
jgi:hypothetical protein